MISNKLIIERLKIDYYNEILLEFLKFFVFYVCTMFFLFNLFLIKTKYEIKYIYKFVNQQDNII